MKRVSYLPQTMEAELNAIEENKQNQDTKKNEAIVSKNENQKPLGYYQNRNADIRNDIRDVIQQIEQSCMGKIVDKKMREKEERTDQAATEVKIWLEKDQTETET